MIPASNHFKTNQGVAVDRRQFQRALLGIGAGAGLLGTPFFPLSGSGLLASNAVPDRKNSPNEKSPAELITAPTRRTIDRALSYLLRSQVKQGRQRGAFASGGLSGGVATCALGGLAMMCGGHAPGEGQFGKAIDLCVDFLVNNTRDDGYIAIDGGVRENMYGHGFAMLFLSQAYGMTRKAAIGDKLRKAVNMTIRAQNDEGGWRYQPVKSDADLSVTVCQIMALRGARDAGIDVPDETRIKCIEYVKKSQNRNGSFRYTMHGGHTTFAMTAAGVTSLYSAGIYEGEQVETALDYMEKFKPNAGRRGGHYFYEQYYAVQAMWHAGGKHWNQWYPEIRDELVRTQTDEGSWPSSEAGPEFGAAMGSIILQMPLNYLPIFAP